MTQVTKDESSKQTLRRPSAWLSILLGWIIAGPGNVGAAESIRVMSFNLWHGGDAGKQPLSQTLEVIRAAKADIVGLQETGGYELPKASASSYAVASANTTCG